MSNPHTIRIPRLFYEDHEDRDLDTPVAIKTTKRHVWIDPADPALGELLSDARYYSDPYGFDPECFGLCMSARATAKAIESYLNREVG